MAHQVSAWHREMVQQVKCVACNHGDWSSDPRTHIKAQQAWQHSCIPSMREAEKGNPRGKETLFNVQRGEKSKETPPVNVHTPVHEPTQVNVYCTYTMG